MRRTARARTCAQKLLGAPQLTRGRGPHCAAGSRTHGQDAAAYADGVIKERSCSAKVRAGTGFYTAACPGSGSHLVWVGEPGNLYMVEISGYYDRGVKALVEGYISAVVNGKRVFRDRNIGLLDHQS